MARSRSEEIRQSHEIPGWLASPWFLVLMAVAVGIFAAQLVLGTLPPRWVKATVGFAFLLALFRLPIHAVVALFLIAFPFPTFIFLGNSNVIFVLLMIIAWAVRVRLGLEHGPPKTYLDWACWLYIGVHLLSLVNVDSGKNLANGLFQVQFLSAAVGLYFLVSKTIRTERHLRIVFQALAVTSLLVALTGVMEYFVPKLQLIPDWFIAPGPHGKRFGEGGRVGGVFRFHGLLADFCAMMFILQAYLFIRSRNAIARSFYLLLMLSGLFLLFVTANRGGFIIWAVGVLYMLWIGRGGLTARRVMVALPILLFAGVVLENVVTRYGRVITLFWRLATTQLERGVPENRVEVWAAVLREIPNHLWIGHGPYYDLLGGGTAMGRWWPHNAYLMYLWTTGVIGLAIFLWIIGKALWRSRPGSGLHLGQVPFSHGALVVAHIQILQFALAQIRDEHQRGNVYVYLMWLYFGLAVAAERIWKFGRQEPHEAAPPQVRDPS